MPPMAGFTSTPDSGKLPQLTGSLLSFRFGCERFEVCADPDDTTETLKRKLAQATGAKLAKQVGLVLTSKYPT
jgi:hypothetical protein